MKRLLPFLIILVVLGVGIGSVVYFKKQSPSPQASATFNGQAPNNSQRPGGAQLATSTPISVSEPGSDPPHALGPANAPVTLEEFGDFQCPPCAALHPELKKIVAKYGSNVRVIFREFPLVPTHEHALTAARAAEAAGMQGKFWQMHGMIYDNQKNWHKLFDARGVFEGYAKQIGLDVERYKNDISSQVVQDRIFKDGKRAHALGVKGTPTVFMNGREVPFESLPSERLGPLIDAELARTLK